MGMARKNLILDRYELLGTAGTGGFATVSIAWDPRIQRKVAIKTIRLTELDAYRAALPGANASAPRPTDTPGAAFGSSPAASGAGALRGASAPASTADRWHGVLPWEDYLEEEAAAEGGRAPIWARPGEGPQDYANYPAPPEVAGQGASEFEPAGSEQVTSLAHLPGLDEARTAAMLDDPRIVTVYDFEIRDRTAYLIMEYVEGITLSRLLAEYGDDLSLDMVTSVFDAVAGALVAAHSAGVLHLDIKPDNIIITPSGQAKVTDFGLATLADASGAGTTGGGTIGYMPLEQMRREHLDARTDEWSLAALTYEMLTGDNPFRAPNLAEAERAIEEAELVVPSLCWSDIDEQIDDVVFYALDPDREERYASVADFAEEMDKFLGDARQGTDELAWAVSDALGLLDEGEGEGEATAPEDEAYDAWEEPPASGGGLRVREALSTVFPGLHVAAGPAGTDGFEREADEDGSLDDEYAFEEPGQSAPAATRKQRAPRVPLNERFGSRFLSGAARVFAAVAGAALAALAMVNMPWISAFGPWQMAVVGAVAAACAVAGALKPSIGALASYCLFGAALALGGQPIVAALFIVAVVAWWYAVGHEGMAAANVVLLAPVAGAFGAAIAVPLVAGRTLKPLPAVGTVALAAFAALVLAAVGTQSLAGWDAFANYDFAGVDATGVLLGLLRQPSTWAAIGSWLAAALAFAVLRLRGGRVLSVVGLVLACAILLAGILPFFPASPHIVISLAAAALALVLTL